MDFYDVTPRQVRDLIENEPNGDMLRLLIDLEHAIVNDDEDERLDLAETLNALGRW